VVSVVADTSNKRKTKRFKKYSDKVTTSTTVEKQSLSVTTTESGLTMIHDESSEVPNIASEQASTIKQPPQ